MGRHPTNKRSERTEDFRNKAPQDNGAAWPDRLRPEKATQKCRNGSVIKDKDKLYWRREIAASKGHGEESPGLAEV